MMGITIGSAYGLGANLGFAEVFSSVGDKNNAATSLRQGAAHGANLTNQGVGVQKLERLANNPEYEHILAERNALTKIYRNIQGSALGDVFELGVCIAIAEGQAALGAPNIVKTSLQNSLQFGNKLSKWIDPNKIRVLLSNSQRRIFKGFVKISKINFQRVQIFELIIVES
jgi:hypothetical protein